MYRMILSMTIVMGLGIHAEATPLSDYLKKMKLTETKVTPVGTLRNGKLFAVTGVEKGGMVVVGTLRVKGSKVAPVGTWGTYSRSGPMRSSGGSGGGMGGKGSYNSAYPHRGTAGSYTGGRSHGRGSH